MQQLQSNATLQSGKYKIIKVLGQGGFGITYLAEQTMLDGLVAIKEFFFKQYCDRDDSTSQVTMGTSGNREIVEKFQQKFIKEARTIFKLNHPNIVRILDIFEENGTAYYVMDYIDGESLGDMVKRRGALPENEAIEYIREVGKALTYIHGKNMNHLDIKPGNIMKRKEDGQILVIDFGVAKQYDAETSEGTTTTPVGISHGYSPSEQYQRNGVQSFSPQSDVYALAATLFKLLTGKTPPEAIMLIDEGLPVEELEAKGVSKKTIDAIDAAMQPKRKRTQSVDEFIRNLGDGEGNVKTLNNEPDKEVIEPHNEVVEPVEEIIETNEEIIKPLEEIAEPSDETVVDIPKVSEPEVAIEIPMSKMEFDINGVRFNMIKVEGGIFKMKEKVNSGFLGLSSQEILQRAKLTDYWIGETLVTQTLWNAVMGNNPSHFIGDKKPVESVSWNDCQDFILKLNEITGKKFSLPTEAQWEYAARGGNRSNNYKYSGSDKIEEVAWYEGNSEKTTHDVAIKKPNELGLYDMSGNVYEWCNDWHGDYVSYTSLYLTNPTGARKGSNRVIRGGSWFDGEHCSSVARNYYNPNESDMDLGLRLALSE